jgi:microcompartment protein CcmL/EutN
MSSIFLIKNVSDRPIAVGGKISAARKARDLSTQHPKRVVEVVEYVVIKMPAKQLYAAIFNDTEWYTATRRIVAFRSGFEIIGWGEETFETAD